jgi:PAS domain S-box-containing protein
MSPLLEALREPARTLMDAAALAIGAHDPAGRVIYVNRALATLFGVDPSVLIGRILHLGLVPEERVKYEAQLARWALGKAQPLELMIRDPAGQPRPYLFSPAPILSRKAGFLGVVYVVLPRSLAEGAFVEQVQATTALVRSTLVAVSGAPGLSGGQPEPSFDELRESVPALARLSAREFEVACLLARGERTAEIARGMAISQNTVRNHLKAVFRKVGVEDQATLIGRFRGWVRGDRGS